MILLVDLSINNLTDIDAENVVLTINPVDENLEIINNQIFFNNVDAYESSYSSVVMNVSENSFGKGAGISKSERRKTPMVPRKKNRTGGVNTF